MTIELSKTPACGQHKAFTATAALMAFIMRQPRFPVDMPPVMKRDGTMMTSKQIRSILYRLTGGKIVLLKDGEVFRLYKPAP